MRILVAPDKFKGCLTAAEVAASVADGLRAERPSLQVTRLPIADGGDGTVAAALSRGYEEVRLSADGPTGVPGETGYARLGSRAVVELAAVCGLDLLPGGRRDALGASTYGLGQVIGHAVDNGATEVVVGLGGSASTDGGAGMVQALGARLLDDSGHELDRGGAALAGLASLDLTTLVPRLAGVTVVLASDVENPLLGPDGAAAVFGPQKGADVDQVAQLDAALTRWADVVAATVGTDHRDRSGAGAAGGTGFGGLALLGAELRSGAELVLELIDFDTHLAQADLVITGEGSLDVQSLSGKGPIELARTAVRAGVPVIAVVGHSGLTEQQARDAGLLAVYPLSALEPDLARSIAQAPTLLHTVGERIARTWPDRESLPDPA